jgi:hypothetical protein
VERRRQRSRHHALDRRSTRWLFVKGRLAGGRPRAGRAQAEAVFAQLATDHPLTNAKAVVSLGRGNVRFHPMVDGYVRAASAELLGAVGCAAHRVRERSCAAAARHGAAPRMAVRGHRRRPRPAASL